MVELRVDLDAVVMELAIFHLCHVFYVCTLMHRYSHELIPDVFRTWL